MYVRFFAYYIYIYIYVYMYNIVNWIMLYYITVQYTIIWYSAGQQHDREDDLPPHGRAEERG